MSVRECDFNKPKPTLGYPSRGEAVRALAKQGLDPATIAQRICTTTNAVHSHMQMSGKVRRPNYSRLALAPAAKARNMHVVDLEDMLLDIIAREGLVDAILDDRQEAAEYCSLSDRKSTRLNSSH